MKKIDISTKKYPKMFAEVDDSDFESLNAHKWCTSAKYKGKFYAVRSVCIDEKWVALLMHTAILGKVVGKEVDHCDGNGLNNQRYNLRHCTKSENQMNKDAPVNNTSGYKGVHWDKEHKQWRTQTTHNSKRIHLGYFTCLIRAAKAYDVAVKELFGDFARLNFPERK